MGVAAKLLVAQQEDKREIALTIALRAKALRKCDAHEHVLESGGDPTGAYRLASALIRQKDPLVAPFHGDRRALTDLIIQAICEHGPDCPDCEAAQHD